MDKMQDEITKTASYRQQMRPVLHPMPSRMAS